jgi:hypothetical protein
MEVLGQPREKVSETPISTNKAAMGIHGYNHNYECYIAMKAI